MSQKHQGSCIESRLFSGSTSTTDYDFLQTIDISTDFIVRIKKTD